MLLWSYFSPIDKNSARYDLCDKTVSHRKIASNLFAHFRATHPTAREVCNVMLADFARLLPVQSSDTQTISLTVCHFW